MKKQTPEKAVPRRAADQLVPGTAVGVPGPVAEASERYGLALLAAEAAFTHRVAAEQAAKAAPKADEDAALAATESGKELPPPTAAAMEAEAEAARRREEAAKTIARQCCIEEAFTRWFV